MGLDEVGDAVEVYCDPVVPFERRTCRVAVLGEAVVSQVVPMLG
jgi:hypothetical protein